VIAPRDEVMGTPIGEHGGRRALGDSDGSRPAVIHDFSVCLNAFGASDIVRRAIVESRVDEYPDPACRDVRRAAAGRWNVPMSDIAFGAGAAELIHAVAFAYLRRDDSVIVAGPAFGEYARAAMLCGATVTTVSVDDGTTVDLDRLVQSVEQRRPRLVFAATPMSPTGVALDIAQVTRLAECCRRVDALLVLDQAYDAFAAHPLGTPVLPGHSHVLHLRSSTKDHALAGVRVAFGVGPAHVIDALERARVPWVASTAAQAAGIAALSDEALAHVAATTARLRHEAARIAGAMAAARVETRLCSTHYFLVQCGRAAQARQHLLDRSHILVRDCTSFGMPEWIRIAARTPEENDILIAAITTLSTQPA
jgi:histidinol-phosphate/aromatic aminotransferase/cobyric acid decarboxylase-like protein